MTKVIHTTGKRKVLRGTVASFEPCCQTLSSFLHDLELHWSPNVLLDDGRPTANVSGAYDITDLGFDKITPSKLAVDCQVEQCSITQPSALVEIKPDCPYITRLRGRLGVTFWPAFQGRRSCTAGQGLNVP
ncbi:hypothetical protein M2338_000189 [Sphingobium sp. B2D3B]|nr:hypothetical protein [Sphingobium sp. B2D3B]MCW2399268.1 hypothetical protein [Sphingobium sp. B2D3C]